MLIGIEIGGTKLQACLADMDGKIVHIWRTTVNSDRQAAGIRETMSASLPELMKLVPPGQQLAGVGVGYGGPVDAKTGKTIISHQILGWENFPLAEWLGQLLKSPVLVGNDADVAGLGEATKGAGREHGINTAVSVASRSLDAGREFTGHRQRGSLGIGCIRLA